MRFLRRWPYGGPTPILTSISPTTGTTGTVVTLTGDNFDWVREVRFGGTLATITSRNATEFGDTLVVSAPAHADMTVAVTASGDGGTAVLYDAFTYSNISADAILTELGIEILDEAGAALLTE